MAEKGRFVSYLRVSSKAQGKSGLGIEAQRAAVASYLGGSGAKVVAEFVEVESGKRSDRPALDRALAVARVHQAALVVAKVDRLTRSVGFLSRLLEAGVDVRFADLPVVEGPTGRFILQQMAAVAELEAGMISSRTKAALVAAKARGQRLGGFRGTVMSDDARAAGRKAQVSLANRRAIDLSPVFDELVREGHKSPTEIARALTARGIPTIRERGPWSAHQVVRIQARLAKA
ncbi:recombinase family protein [Tardiphaga robiniae]|uniref:Recombinase family protein n=1 Tax=Tardiphaga robiniae TaxID=943830 RepID=A0A7G6U4R7_9BRAD|nr:recombinase family protein [Tardiphaga robiniae]QND73999.1 recombinase family protein [Tardiphaga robiniae]